MVEQGTENPRVDGHSGPPLMQIRHTLIILKGLT